jgi:chemotaxis protein CheC
MAKQEYEDMSTQKTGWYNIGSVSRMEIIVAAGLLNAARGLEEFVGCPITMGTIQAKAVRFDELSAGTGAPASESVGIYLQMKGSLGGQALLILPIPSALNLVDLLQEAPPGTTASLGDMERSALAEAGDVMVSYFLNAVAGLTRQPLLPSTPTVMVDMLATILDKFIAPMDKIDGELMVMETVLYDTQGLIEARFWVLPDFAPPLE